MFIGLLLAVILLGGGEMARLEANRYTCWRISEHAHICTFYPPTQR